MKVFSLCVLLALLAACNNEVRETVRRAPKDKFDAIDGITGIANWRVVDGTDTSYLYFSRMGDALIHVYHFSISKGDSVNTQMFNIVNRGDSVVWAWGNKGYLLSSIDSNTARWEDLRNRKDVIILKKADRLHMSFLFPDGHEATMQQTLPLSTFLVRRKYDYLHGTSYTDSALIKPRKTTR